MGLDVQGEELEIVSAGMEQINKQVKRLHIGNHADELEDRLRKPLTENDWVCVRDSSCLQANGTICGDVEFGRGVQSGPNPRFQLTWG